MGNSTLGRIFLAKNIDEKVNFVTHTLGCMVTQESLLLQGRSLPPQMYL